MRIMTERTTVCVVGGGPAGMVLGLLLARAGVEVTVLEKHADFLRDFRGDTVHASTLTLLDELGLTEEFAKTPARYVTNVQVLTDGGPTTIGALNLLPGAHKHIAFVPQWDFLDMLADAAKQEPSFTLRVSTEVTGPIMENGRVAGVHYRTADGVDGELRADLTVACDGRYSKVRAAAGLVSRDFGVPMDAWWFRVPRHEGEPEGATGRFSTGQALVLIDRDDYYQCAYLIRKGEDQRLRARGVEKFRERVIELVPFLADRVQEIRSLDDVKLLDVRLDRLPRWYTDGLLCIGDAAHAMSPVGGVGINLAIQDAVAAARILAPRLRAGRVDTRDLARVQNRRWLPTALTQGLQRIIHKQFLGKQLTGELNVGGGGKPPLPFRLLRRFPALQVIPAYVVAIGFGPEHAPDFARRPARTKA
ncbi:FAD-dependent oxidoreductase [Pseudonocardiaceae bacterium YIM PH 21723]|nr:FAD-dependent oxidoreductase [Pseudonocardiaceae bacterium YIM PH 21723]